MAAPSGVLAATFGLSGKALLQGRKILPVGRGEIAFRNIFLIPFKFLPQCRRDVLAFQQLADPFDVGSSLFGRNDLVLEIGFVFFAVIAIIIIVVVLIRPCGCLTVGHEQIVPGQT